MVCFGDEGKKGACGWSIAIRNDEGAIRLKTLIVIELNKEFMAAFLSSCILAIVELPY